MRKNRYKYFRWTPRTARITFIYVVAVPFLLGVVAKRTDVRNSSVRTLHARARARAREARIHVSRLICGVQLTGQIQLPGEEKGRFGLRILERGINLGGNIVSQEREKPNEEAAMQQMESNWSNEQYRCERCVTMNQDAPPSTDASLVPKAGYHISLHKKKRRLPNSAAF